MKKDVKKYAILIGINGYHESLGALNFCTNDARLMQETLASGCCAFPSDNVVVLADDQPKDRQPTFGNIHSWLGTWLSRPGPDDLVLIYFAGHGREANGQALLAPMDATLDSLPVTGIPVRYICDLLERCRARQKVLILDACHSGAGRDVATMSATFREALDTGMGLYTIASCDADQISYEWPEKQHGLFTHYLAEAIRNGAPVEIDGKVSLDHVYDWTRNSILTWTTGKRLKQEPVRVCRTRGAIHIGSRLLTSQQQLEAAEAKLRAQEEVISSLQSEVERLSNENTSLRAEHTNESQTEEHSNGRGTLKVVIFPGHADVEYYLDGELMPQLAMGADVEAGPHKIIVIPESMCWGNQERKIIVSPGDVTRMVVRLRRVAHWRPLTSFGVMGIFSLVFVLAYQHLASPLTGEIVAWLALWAGIDLLATLVAAFAVKGLRRPKFANDEGENAIGSAIILMIIEAGLMGLSVAAWYLSMAGSQHASPLIVAAVHIVVLGSLLLIPFPARFYRTRGT